VNISPEAARRHCYYGMPQRQFIPYMKTLPPAAGGSLRYREES